MTGRALDSLSKELACSRNEVLRVALRLLRREDAYRREVRATSFARACVDRLRGSYGPDALLECDTGSDAPAVKINGQPAPQVNAVIRRSEHFVHLDLIDSTTDAEEPRDLKIPARSTSRRRFQAKNARRTSCRTEGPAYLDKAGRSSLPSEHTRAEFVR